MFNNISKDLLGGDLHTPKPMVINILGQQN